MEKFLSRFVIQELLVLQLIFKILRVMCGSQLLFSKADKFDMKTSNQF